MNDFRSLRVRVGGGPARSFAAFAVLAALLLCAPPAIPAQKETSPLLPHGGSTERHLPLEAPQADQGPGAVPAPSAPGFSGDQWQALQRRGIVRVELRPSRPRLVSAPFSGLLREVFVRDGEEVKKDSPVALFDADAFEGALQEARKDMDAALDRVQGAQGTSATVQDYARQELARKADALREAQARLDQVRLTAPATGRVMEIFAKAGQHVKRGDPIAELAEPGDMEIVCTVPSAWIARVKAGHVIWVYVNETAKSYEAEFTRFAGKVNSADNSIKAYAAFRGSVPELLPGMSGRADFFPRRSGR